MSTQRYLSIFPVSTVNLFFLLPPCVGRIALGLDCPVFLVFCPVFLVFSCLFALFFLFFLVFLWFSCVNCQSLLSFAATCQRDCPRIAFLSSYRVLSGNTLPPFCQLLVGLFVWQSLAADVPTYFIFFFFQKFKDVRVHSDILFHQKSYHVHGCDRCFM